jgi:hypothetical protein
MGIGKDLVEELKTHRTKQLEARLEAGGKYQDQGLICARSNGDPWNPGTFSGRFTDLVRRAGGTRVRLHDLRHYADPGIMPTSAGEPRLVAVGRVPVSA